MRLKKLLLFLCLCITPCIVHPGEKVTFYPPTLSPEKALKFTEWHFKKENINLDKYKLTTLKYSYGPRKWIIGYTLNYDDNMPLRKFLKIYMSDEYPCAYDIERDPGPNIPD